MLQKLSLGAQALFRRHTSKQAIQELLRCNLPAAATSAFDILTWEPVLGGCPGQIILGPEAVIRSGNAVSYTFNFTPSVLRDILKPMPSC